MIRRPDLLLPRLERKLRHVFNRAARISDDYQHGRFMGGECDDAQDTIGRLSDALERLSDTWFRVWESQEF